VLEPKLLGKELGLDPLVTLLSIYAGYRLLGLPGMLLAPLLAVVLTKLLSELSKKEKNGRKTP
jgi:predicted PurR-regulated permease PerM